MLLAIIFTEFFGVTLAQLVGAIAPSIQVCSLSCFPPGFETCADLDLKFL